MAMSALPPSQMAAMRETASAEAFDPIDALLIRWDAVHTQAARIAELAQISAEPVNAHSAAFPVLLAEANSWQQDIARRGIEDIDAMMRVGVSALANVTARGQDASVPALALWREFHHAREAVLMALLPHAEAA